MQKPLRKALIAVALSFKEGAALSGAGRTRALLAPVSFAKASFLVLCTAAFPALQNAACLLFNDKRSLTGRGSPCLATVMTASERGLYALSSISDNCKMSCVPHAVT